LRKLPDFLGRVQEENILPLREETNYYPFGLTMAGISSKALNGVPKNKEKTFQGQRFDDEFDLNWVQFKWRNHDPQIGRFIEIDPLSNNYVHNSTYAFSENQVTSHVELEGLEKVSIAALLQNDKTNYYPVSGLVDLEYDFNKNSIRVLIGAVGGSASSYEYNITNKTLDIQSQDQLSYGDVLHNYYKPTAGRLKPDILGYVELIDKITLGITSFSGYLKDQLKTGSAELSKALGMEIDLITTIKDISNKMANSKNWNMSTFYSNDENKNVPNGQGGTEPQSYRGEMSVGLWRKNVPLITDGNGKLISAILIFQYQDQTVIKPAEEPKTPPKKGF